MFLETSSIEVGIITLLDNYFDLMHEQDMDLFDQVFHKDSTLYGIVDGQPNLRSFAVYKDAMANRQSPRELGNKRRDHIIFVDQLTSEFALARVQLEMFGGVMQDYLNLVKLDGQWFVMAKMWTRIADAAE
ncbi:MAG: nuclear transport factor 2 family protein [Micrococcales bacterium]